MNYQDYAGGKWLLALIVKRIKFWQVQPDAVSGAILDVVFIAGIGYDFVCFFDQLRCGGPRCRRSHRSLVRVPADLEDLSLDSTCFSD